MSNMEEKLWDYIDGNLTAKEQIAIEQLITGDERYRQKYQELLTFNQEMAAGVELDEPHMAFTYNVMEAIRTEYATQKPLKTRVNKGLMWAIGGFFIISLTVMLGISLGSIHWSAGSHAVSNTTPLPNFKALLSGSTLKVFLFFDTVLLLFLADGFMRKRLLHKQA